MNDFDKLFFEKLERVTTSMSATTLKDQQKSGILLLIDNPSKMQTYKVYAVPAGVGDHIEVVDEGGNFIGVFPRVQLYGEVYNYILGFLEGRDQGFKRGVYHGERELRAKIRDVSGLFFGNAQDL